MTNLPILPTNEIVENNVKAILPKLDESLYSKENISFESELEKVAMVLLFEAEWKNDAINQERFKDFLPGISKLTLNCKAENCPFASKCGVLKSLPKHRWKSLEDTDCREEYLFGVKTFVKLITDLHISPTETPDLLSVAQLVRLHIQYRRADMELAINAISGMMGEKKSANQKTGLVFISEYVNHPLVLLQASLQKQIESLTKSLVASRRDRMEQLNNSRKSGGMMDKFIENLKKANQVSDADWQEVS